LVRARRWLPAVAIAVICGVLYAVRISGPAFFDNEGRYAEVARQMVATGDWITPRLDDTLFLNKPPLTFWLAALSFETLGQGEAARLASIGTAMVAIVSTVRLGGLLYGELTGCLAGLLLATTFGFVLEARTLRPDMLVVATVATALLCFAHVEVGDERRRGRWLVGAYAALGVGMQAKGFVPAALAGLAIAAITWPRHGAALARLVSVPGS
jgi:4-amino-4-deoxy-L-arabinose transferase-like glycosyltransferase